MDPERFRGNKSGQVIRVGTGDAAYWAYVPNPLPPTLDIDLQAVAALSEADRALGELAGVGRAMPNPHLLIGPFVRREAVASSRIEGTRADLSDLYAFEGGQRSSGRDVGDVQEVVNYVRAMEHGLKRLDTLPVSLRLLREVHAVLMTGARGGHATPGEFRTSQNWIGAPSCSLTDADFVPAPATHLMSLLGDMEHYLQEGNGYPPLVRLAFVHQQFETIHPFLDGNGRLGRLLVTFLMVNWGLLPLPLLYLSTYFEENRQDYYRLLRAVSEQDSWRDWVVFFLRGVSAQARDAIDRARRLQDLQLEWRKMIIAARGSACQLHLADLLFEQPVISISEARLRLDTTYPTARATVAKLVSLGILRQANGSDYGKRFVCEPIMAITGAAVAERGN